MQERPLKAVIIGADAAGMSAASQIKRRIKSAEVIVLEKTEDVSYGACGMPYNIGYNAEIEELMVMSAKDFKEKRGIDVRLLNEAVGLDTDSNKVLAKNIASGREYELEYDKLVIATGAKASSPVSKGIDSDGVFKLKTLEDARIMKKYIGEKNPVKAVLIGGGFINLEMADNFHRLGIKDITILKRSDYLMSGYEEEIDTKVKEILAKNGINLVTGVDIEEIENLEVKTNKGGFKSDIVNIATGFLPNTGFLENSTIKIDETTKAIEVDRFFKTNIDGVYASGDCAMLYHRILNRNIYFPSGSNANKSGKLAGANIAGANEEFAGVVGTKAFETFNTAIGKTGLSLDEARKEGYNAFKTVISAPTKAHGFPIQGKITVIMIADKSDGRLLGAQMIGDDSAALRIDVMASALYANMTIKDIQNLDLVYSPPFAPVWDPILVCANQAIKQVGR
jgi:NADPH-dependent 2,4-dienoyl-CoA reductase/sulfur reductase-like enzyme